MAKHRGFFDKDYRQHIGATAFLVTSILGIIFVVCGTPEAMFLEKSPANGRSLCITLWGERPYCGTPDYSFRHNSNESCMARRTRFEAAGAMCIVSMFFYVMSILAAWNTIAGEKWKWWGAGLGLLSVGAVTVGWACVVAIHFNAMCGTHKYPPETHKYGAGFALLLTSFCVQCVGVILLVALE